MRIVAVIRAGIDKSYVGAVSGLWVCVEVCAWHQTANIELKQMVTMYDC
jgi:ethanolamine ammonia-lyase large subunit